MKVITDSRIRVTTRATPRSEEYLRLRQPPAGLDQTPSSLTGPLEPSFPLRSQWCFIGKPRNPRCGLEYAAGIYAPALHGSKDIQLAPVCFPTWTDTFPICVAQECPTLIPRKPEPRCSRSKNQAGRSG